MLPRKTAAAVIGLLLAACGPSGEAPPPPRTPAAGGTVIVSTRADMDTVNGLISSGSAQRRNVERLLFLQLARENDDFARGPSTFAPQLAESWEFSDDGMTLTFHLRGATWSDGEPITAEDVRWTWQAQVDEQVAWRHQRQKGEIDDVEVVDPRTVRFHFATRYPDQLEDANVGVVLPKHAWGQVPFSEWRSSAGRFAESIVSSGPFTLEEWRPNQELILRRNERYHRQGRPYLERFVFRVIPDKSTQISQLLGGSIDYVMTVPPDQIERIESHPDAEIDAYWGRQFDYLCWNARREPLGDANVRRALTRAVDRQTIIDSIYRGYARVGVTAILSSTWAFDPDLEPWPYAPAVAKRELDDAGLVERDGERLRLELLVQNGNRVHLNAATLIQAQLARIGVVLDLRPVEFQTWVEGVKSGDFDVAIGGWNIPSSLDMSFAFHTDEIGKFNLGGYTNAELDSVLDDARLTSSHAERLALLHEVQAILHREQPYTFLWEPQTLNARRLRLRDSRPNALSDFYSIDEWWVGD